MNTRHGPYEIDDDLARVDFARVHAWLDATYWAAVSTRSRLRPAAQ